MVSRRNGKGKAAGAGGTGSARRRRPKPAWDNTVQDHSQYRFSRDEMERRKELFTSRHQMPGVERLRELCEKYERKNQGDASNSGQEGDSKPDPSEAEGGEGEVEQENLQAGGKVTETREEASTSSKFGSIETFDDLVQHSDKYGKLDPHEILFEYRTSNRAQKIVDTIQHIIDINLGKIETMMSEMNVHTIRQEVQSVRNDVDDMKETQVMLRDEIQSMKKEFGGLLSSLQTNFQSLLTEKYNNPRTQYSNKQLDSGPYLRSEAENALDFTETRRALPSVPIHVRKTPRHELFVDGDDDDLVLPLYSEMIRKSEH